MKRQRVFLLLNLVFMMLLSQPVFSKSFTLDTLNINKQVDFVFNETTPHNLYLEINMIKTVANHQHFTYTTSIPQFSNAKIDRFISSYTQHIVDHFVKLAKQPHYLLKQTTKASLDVSVEVYKFKNNFYSLVFNKRSFINRIQIAHEKHVLMVDLPASTFVLASEFFKDTTTDQQAINDVLHKKYPDVSKTSIDYAINQNQSLVSQMYLTSNSFVFIYNLHDDFNHLSGFKELTIPFVAVESHISTKWLSKLIVRETPIIRPQQPNQPLPPLGDGPRRIALTFDDGPHGTHTITILNILKKYNVKATFFMLGIQVSRFPQVAKMVADAGHEIGNHSWNHENLRTLSAGDLRSNLNRTNQLIKEVTNITPKLMRPPYGHVNDFVKNNTDMRIIMWNVDPQDWKYRNAQTVYQHVRYHARDGSVVLLHDIFGSSAEATEYIVKYLVDQKFKFMTISEMYGY